jgi:hypothetical protein
MRFAEIRIIAAFSAITLACVLLGCGGSGGSKSSSPANANNTQPVVVNSGPAGNYANGLFTTVTVCVPGTSNCQALSGVLVDTGSFGLRVLSSALTVPLSQQKDGSGNSVAECAQFALGITWGPVKTADIKIAGEQASAIPIQVIGDPAFSTVPSGCSAKGAPQDTLQSLAANGILGIGSFIQDCGPACAPGTNSNPGFYYGCAGSSCQVITQSTAQQIQNPVAFFSADNNGVIVDLPAVSTSAPTLSGSLIFGIGTQSDNSLGSAQVFTLDNSGNFTTTFKGTPYSSSFIDSGSNGYFFLNSSTTGIPTCPNPNSGFYCPSSPVNLSATNTGANGSSNTVNFTIDNANTLFSNAGDNVFPTLGGPNSGAFDWGLPFFFGRKVYTAIEGRTTPGGPGPYWAY